MSNELFTEQDERVPQRVIGLAGRKGSGKDASARFIAGINLVTHGYIEEFKSMKNGDLEIGGVKYKDLNSIAPEFVKIYHFADYLKEICEKVLGVSYRILHVYKASNTHLKWENMPGVITNKDLYNSLTKFCEKKVELFGNNYSIPIMYHSPGYMTGRDIMQFLGTEIFRRMHQNCWIECLRKRILEDSPKIAIVADCRFINELNIIKGLSGICVNLTRGSTEDDHSSEIDFLSYDKWDCIIDNRQCEDIRCLNKMLYENLLDLGVFKQIDIE